MSKGQHNLCEDAVWCCHGAFVLTHKLIWLVMAMALAFILTMSSTTNFSGLAFACKSRSVDFNDTLATVQSWVCSRKNFWSSPRANLGSFDHISGFTREATTWAQLTDLGYFPNFSFSCSSPSLVFHLLFAIDASLSGTGSPVRSVSSRDWAISSSNVSSIWLGWSVSPGWLDCSFSKMSLSD